MEPEVEQVQEQVENQKELHTVADNPEPPEESKDFSQDNNPQVDGMPEKAQIFDGIIIDALELENANFNAVSSPVIEDPADVEETKEHELTDLWTFWYVYSMSHQERKKKKGKARWK